MTEAQPFFTWGAGGAQMTPERIASERKVAQALMERGMDYSPVQHWTQGVSRVAQALMGGVDSRMADAAERRNVDADKDMIAGWFGGQKPAVPATAGAAALPPPSVAPAPSSAPVVIGEGGLAKPDAGGVYDADAVLMPNSTAHGPAIAGIETPGSKDPYAAIGPATRTGARAYGKYQVMDFNIGPWTKEVLGRELTPDQFRASPDAQEAVFNQKFGQGAKSPQDAASMWFTGRPAAEGASSRAVTPAGVPYGPTGRSYVDMFTKKLGPTAPPADSPALALAAPQGGAPAIAAPAATPAPVAPAAAAAAPAGIAGVNPSMLAAITSPYTSEGTKKIAQIMLQHQMAGDTVSHIDLGGQIGIMDKRGNIIRTIQKTETGTTQVDLGNEVGIMDKAGNVIRRLPKGEPNKSAEWKVIRKDEFGNETYGWVDPRDRSITEPRGGAPATPMTVTGPDGKPIPIPAGADPKKFRADVTSATADALTGKKTEVQAKSEKFGNKMELAERNLSRLEQIDPKNPDAKKPADEVHGPDLVHRGLEYLPGGNMLQDKGYQKYKQARDNFITALLRDESGAAIGSAEFNRYEKELFPQPGDGPDVIKQKREARRIAIEGMKKTAGPGYKSPKFDDDTANKTATGVTWSVE